MAEELFRMKQRRGEKLHMPMVAEDGEINITLDTEEFFYGANGNHIKVIDEKSVVDSLDNPSTKLPISANQAVLLNMKIEDIQDYVSKYVSSLGDDFDSKQDIMAHKGISPPSDISLLWIDTST